MHSLHFECWMIHTFCKHYCFPQKLLNRSSIPAKISVEILDDSDYVLCWWWWWWWWCRKVGHSMQTGVWDLAPNAWDPGWASPPLTLDDHVVVGGDVVLSRQLLQELLLAWLWDRGLSGARCAGVVGKGREGDPGGELLDGQRGQSRARARVRWVLEHQVGGGEERA